MSSNTADLKPLLATVASGASLSEEEARRAFDILMAGDATPAQMGAFLMALRVRGETVDEIAGAVRIMRDRAMRIDAPEGTIDTCGTGGDASGTYNVSTAVALVVAACGVPVAKHGNRAMSSKSGAADVLAALGVNIDADMSLVHKALWEANICFLMAPRHHSAMRNVAGVRVELGTRTIFNIMGPLSNPAGARRQLIGVYSAQWLEPLAQVLQRLGSERAWIVHGSDGLDEITTTAKTDVAELADGQVRRFTLSPADAGLDTVEPAALKGGDAETNAAAIRSLLAGTGGAYRDIVLLNAAASLIIAGRADTLTQGVKLAAQAIDSGKAGAVLDHLATITTSHPPSTPEGAE